MANTYCLRPVLQHELRNMLSQEVRDFGNLMDSPSQEEQDEDIDGDLRRDGGYVSTQEGEDPGQSGGDVVVAALRDATDVLIDALYADVPLPSTNNPARRSHYELQG